MEEWSSSQGQSTDYGKLWIRGSETWNSHCYSQLTPVVPRLQLSLIQPWELEHSKFHWRKERLVLEAIQGGESAKDIFLNKSMNSQALIHTVQTSSTERCMPSACPTPNPVWVFLLFQTQDLLPSFAHSQLWQRLPSAWAGTCDPDIWKGKLSGFCTFWWVCKNIHKTDLGPF